MTQQSIPLHWKDNNMAEKEEKNQQTIMNSFFFFVMYADGLQCIVWVTNRFLTGKYESKQIRKCEPENESSSFVLFLHFFKFFQSQSLKFKFSLKEILKSEFLPILIGDQQTFSGIFTSKSFMIMPDYSDSKKVIFMLINS